MLTSCMNDPAFLEAFKNNNPGLANKMSELSADASGAVSSSDFLKNLNLSAGEKRKMLKNGVNAKNPLAKFNTDFFSENLDDASGTLLSNLNNNIDKAIIDGTNEDLKNKQNEIKEASQDSKELIKLVNNDPLFDAIAGNATKNQALKALEEGVSKDELIDNCFNAIANDPQLSKLLLESNPDLMEEFKNQNATNDVFGPDGLRIDPNQPLTIKLVMKVSSLDSVDENTHKFSKNHDLVLSNDQVNNTKTGDNFKTFGDLMKT